MFEFLGWTILIAFSFGLFILIALFLLPPLVWSLDRFANWSFDFWGRVLDRFEKRD